MGEWGEFYFFNGTEYVTADFGVVDDAGDMGPDSVSCPTTAFCMAVDSSGQYLTYNGVQWSNPASFDTTWTIMGPTSVSCPNSTLCVAVDGDGQAFTYNGSTEAWSGPERIDDNWIITSVSCPTTTLCVAVDANANYLVYDEGSWSEHSPTPVPTYKNANDLFEPLESVSCPTTTFCTAVGSTVEGQGYALTFDGRTWSSPAIFANPSFQANGLAVGFDSVSCASATLCVTAGLGGTYVGR
jgi:hypothetical protein